MPISTTPLPPAATIPDVGAQKKAPRVSATHRASSPESLKSVTLRRFATRSNPAKCTFPKSMLFADARNVGRSNCASKEKCCASPFSYRSTSAPSKCWRYRSSVARTGSPASSTSSTGKTKRNVTCRFCFAGTRHMTRLKPTTESASLCFERTSRSREGGASCVPRWVSPARLACGVDASASTISNGGGHVTRNATISACGLVRVTALVYSGACIFALSFKRLARHRHLKLAGASGTTRGANAFAARRTTSGFIGVGGGAACA
mmetsp:Transcript_14616/g.61673  ORF Transcript_14616/g.61673 Transcript_14616/m.61673 type:complete len:263 (-) Transcript_14616:1390-2178(-)